MRTVVFILGLLFIECLCKHWGIVEPIEKEVAPFMAYVLLGCVVLDIIKK
jgi:hypothetical protein